MEATHLSAADYGVIDKSHTAHLKDGELSYCGKAITGPVPTGPDHWKTSTGHADGQHCILCDKAYRATHNVVPITYDF